ncbi:MAG: TIGR00153 family protein [Chlamydiae bacterium]|nr:TIGR00153 family protein [Chlamydiota bacterium]
MLTIARLFGKSPFAPLQTHMNKVASCVEKLIKIFECLTKQEQDKIQRLVTDLSGLEHEADLTKNDIRNHLPKSIFLPIDRTHFLEILSTQDSIADQAEAIGILLTLRNLGEYQDLFIDLSTFFIKCCEVFWSAKRIIEEIDELLESSFGGIEAEKVKAMVEETAFKEHEATLMQRDLLKKFFTQYDSISAGSMFLLLKMVDAIADMAKLSEKLANRIRMVLEVK